MVTEAALSRYSGKILNRVEGTAAWTDEKPQLLAGYIDLELQTVKIKTRRSIRSECLCESIHEGHGGIADFLGGCCGLRSVVAAHSLLLVICLVGCSALLAVGAIGL